MQNESIERVTNWTAWRVDSWCDKERCLQTCKWLAGCTREGADQNNFSNLLPANHSNWQFCRDSKCCVPFIIIVALWSGGDRWWARENSTAEFVSTHLHFNHNHSFILANFVQVKLIKPHEFNSNLGFNHQSAQLVPYSRHGWAAFIIEQRSHSLMVLNPNKVIALVRKMHALLVDKMKKLITFILLPSLNHVPLLHDFFTGPLRAQTTETTTTSVDDGPGQFIPSVRVSSWSKCFNGSHPFFSLPRFIQFINGQP